MRYAGMYAAAMAAGYLAAVADKINPAVLWPALACSLVGGLLIAWAK